MSKHRSHSNSERLDEEAEDTIEVSTEGATALLLVRGYRAILASFRYLVLTPFCWGASAALGVSVGYAVFDWVCANARLGSFLPRFGR